MYVNKYFEKVTGFTRREVLGKSCHFLQYHETEKSEIQKMNEALKSGHEIKVVLKNRSASGRIFKNLVALKPIYDDRKVYRYVLSICLDVTKEVDECVSKMLLAQDLMDMIPSIIITDEEDEDEVRGWSLSRGGGCFGSRSTHKKARSILPVDSFR